MQRNRPRTTAAILVGVLTATALPAKAADWPQYRGPNRDGISPETVPLERFPAAGPTILWRAATGPGYSSVAVAGERAYTSGPFDGGQVLLAIDTATGRERWRHPIGSAYSSPYGDGPRSTPVVHGDAVYAIGARGNLHAVRARDGAPLWSRDLESLGGRVPDSGYAATPLVIGSRLLVETGSPEGSFAAFDRADGTLLWKSGSDPAGYASPIELTVDGVHQVVFFSGAGLHALDPGTGRTLWRYPWRSSCPATGVPLNAATPIAVPPHRLVIAGGTGPIAARR